MKERVTTISVEASVDGIKLDVQGATISLGINAIPSIDLVVAPTGGQNASPLEPGVIKPSISYFADIYKTLGTKAQGLKSTGDVDISVEWDGYRPGKDSLSLRGWVLSGVGMSNVSATAAPHLVVSLMHPICRLTKVGSIYETPKSELAKEVCAEAKKGNNFLQIVSKVYAKVRGSSQFFATDGKMPKVFRQNLGVGEFDPNKYLVEPKAAVFLEKQMKDGTPCMKAAIGRTVFSSVCGASTWDMILGVSGKLLLNIVQSEEFNFTRDRLLLEPMAPWKGASITLDEEDCHFTDLPGTDMFKLVGVMARSFSPFVNAITTGIFDGGKNAAKNEKQNLINDVLYVPENIDPGIADGRIMKTSAPMVLDLAYRMDAAHGGRIDLAKVEAKTAIKGGYVLAIKDYCQAVYECTAGSMLMGKAQMALSFKDRSGRMILPGNTCRFVSQGRPIYYGYVRQVVHSLSTSGSCGTAIQMAHVRPDPEYKVAGKSVIAPKSSNAAY